jgi:hypothetical protein
VTHCNYSPVITMRYWTVQMLCALLATARRGQTRWPVVQLCGEGLALWTGSREGDGVSENNRCFFEGWLPNIDLNQFVVPLFSKMVSSIIVHETT